MTVAEGGIARRDVVAAWVGIVLLGSVPRLTEALQAHFPLGDGGLFYTAIEAMRAGGVLPQTIPYNDGIPFVYPPLGFAAAAIAASMPGLDTLTVMQFLPALLAIGVVAVVPWTASRFLGSLLAGLLAGAMVALMPQTYDQLVAGGGVTRALSVLLAMVAIGVAAGPTRGTRRGIATGLLLGLTALAHPQVAIFAFATVAFIWWVRRDSTTFGEAGVAIVAGAAVVLPWLATIVARGQLDSLLAGGQRFDLLVGLVGLVAYPAMQAMHGGVPNVATALAIVGVASSLLFRRWKVPLWLLIVHLLGAPVFISPIAWAIAGADGLTDVVSRMRHKPDSRVRARTGLAGLSIITLVAFLSAAQSPEDPGSKQQPLLPQQVDAAQSIGDLSPDARIAVVTSETWGNDLVGEWLPALSGHTVITTPQGAEWLGVDEFTERTDAHVAAEGCYRLTSECLAVLIESGQLAATHVVVPRGSVAGPRGASDCCPALVETLRNDPRFSVVIDDPGALVVEWLGAD